MKNISRMSTGELMEIIAWDYATSRIPEENRYGISCAYEEIWQELEDYSHQELVGEAIKALLQL